MQKAYEIINFELFWFYHEFEFKSRQRENENKILHYLCLNITSLLRNNGTTVLDNVDVGFVVVARITLSNRPVEGVKHMENHMTPIRVDNITLKSPLKEYNYSFLIKIRRFLILITLSKIVLRDDLAINKTSLNNGPVNLIFKQMFEDITNERSLKFY